MPLMKSLRREEKVFMGHHQEKDLLSSLMISTCLRKKNLALNLLLSYLDNGWIIKVGMIGKVKRRIS
jgi:hypothetical protein